MINLVQANIAHAINAHFKRQRRSMHRTGPVDKVNEDQSAFVNDMIGIFSYNNNGFDESLFRELCMKETD